MKFPRTPHLVWLNTEFEPKDDLLVSEEERQAFYDKPVVIQEKIDGNCIGFDYDENANLKIMHRGSTVSFEDSTVWKNLENFYRLHEEDIFTTCGDRYILYGEWSFWKHTVPYNNLPSFYMAHDMYDKIEERFLPSVALDEILENTSIVKTPTIFKGRVKDLEEYIGRATMWSQFGNTKAEGIYMRIEDDDKLVKRAKVVSPTFHQRFNPEIHWRDQIKETNLSADFVESQWSYTAPTDNLDDEADE